MESGCQSYTGDQLIAREKEVESEAKSVVYRGPPDCQGEGGGARGCQSYTGDHLIARDKEVESGCQSYTGDQLIVVEKVESEAVSHI